MEQSYLKSKKILLVDDEQDLLTLLTSILADEGFQNIVTASSMRQGIAAAKEYTPDIAILDVMLPDGNGFSLFQELRSFSDIPVIFLTAKDEVADKLTGLGIGGDDYIVKPFLPQEVLLRLYAVLRRCYKEDSERIQLADCVIDFGRAEVKKDGKISALTAKEHTLLEILARNANRIVTIDALCEGTWGANPFRYENSLMAHIRRIREKIERNPSSPVSLITVKGLGYKLLVEKR